MRAQRCGHLRRLRSQFQYPCGIPGTGGMVYQQVHRWRADIAIKQG